MTDLLATTALKRNYFGTDGIRGRVGVPPITPEFILKLGWAAGTVLAQEKHSKVLIGKDTRISGYMFESALESGLSAAGVDVYLMGPMPTPAVAYLTRTLRAQAGIVISASHNPYYDNGIKFFSATGSKLADHLELAIERQLALPMTIVNSAGLGKAVRIEDAAGRYIEFCKSTIFSDTAFNGMKIVIDCANGAAYHVAANILRELGATVVEHAISPNGLNINLDCGATHPKHLVHLVLANQADVGIALDGDGDRVVMVDNVGNILDGDDLLYIVAKYYRQTSQLCGGVVGTVLSNLGLEQALQCLGIEFIRVPVGDRNIITFLENKSWILGGEPSGHIVCRNATTTGDGIIVALQVLSAMFYAQAPLQQLNANLKKYPQTAINVKISAQHEIHNSLRISKAVAEAEASLKDSGRVIIRRSGTEAYVRIMVEGVNEQQVEYWANLLADVVREELYAV
jgi:phosphoglucosamine mutase